MISCVIAQIRLKNVRSSIWSYAHIQVAGYLFKIYEGPLGNFLLIHRNYVYLMRDLSPLKSTKPFLTFYEWDKRKKKKFYLDIMLLFPP